MRKLMLSAAMAALVATPALAQTNPPPTQPPTTQAPQTQAPQTTPDTQQNPARQKALEKLTEARDTLAELTKLPEATRLEVQAREQLNDLITNFNGLITSRTDWRPYLDKVEANLTSLIGPEPADPSSTGTAGTAGTTGTGTTAAGGTTGTAVEIDPAVAAKLREMRQQLNEFERIAEGRAPAGTMGGTMTGQPAEADRLAYAEMERQVEAIRAIVDRALAGGETPSSPSVTLSRDDLLQIQKHLQELSAALRQQR